MNNSILSSIRNADGRFFGLYTNDGRVMNAQLIRETPKFIRVFERNLGTETRVAKTNIKKVRSRGYTTTA